jgi:hypothetical protein
MIRHGTYVRVGIDGVVVVVVVVVVIGQKKARAREDIMSGPTRTAEIHTQRQTC